MAEPEDMQRVRDNDPERCQSDSKFGQCSFRSMPGRNVCRMHVTGALATILKQEARNQYNLTRWKGRINDFATSPVVKSLREEIGIARMSLEAILEQCKDAYDIQINSNKIGQMLERIEKLVVSCERIESKAGLTLDKSAAIILAQQIIDIISTKVDDTDIIEEIVNEIQAVIESAGRVTIN
jgi:hypothetical protein